MAKAYKTVHGVRFSKDVDTSGIDWKTPASAEFMAAAKRKPKVRITTMLDADIVEALKKIAEEASEDLGYQTVLNILLRATLFPSPKKARRSQKKKKSNKRKAG